MINNKKEFNKNQIEKSKKLKEFVISGFSYQCKLFPEYKHNAEERNKDGSFKRKYADEGIVWC